MSCLHMDYLQTEVLKWYAKVYGKGFITVEHPQRGIAYTKIDGNRRITIFREDDMHVWAVFTDMLANRELNDSASKRGNKKDNTKELE